MIKRKMPSVLITRPLATAETMAAALQNLGYETAIEPLLSIKPTHVRQPKTGAIDAVMITSGSALATLENRPEEMEELFDIPCFCVGLRTAEKARVFGFRKVQHAASDGAELARLVGRAHVARKNSILHIAGRDVNRETHREIERLGHNLVHWPVYEAVPVEAFTAATRQAFKNRTFDALTFYSPRTAQVFVALIKQAALETCCAGLAAICLSPAVADVLKALNWRFLAAASQPTEEALIARLQEICPVSS